MLDQITSHWDIIGAIFLFVLGHFRSEWELKRLKEVVKENKENHDKEIERLEKEMEEKQKTMWTKIDAANDKLTTVLEKLAEIKGSMDASRPRNQ